MSVLAHTKSRFWILILAASVCFLVITTRSRVRRIEYVSNVGDETEPATALGNAAEVGFARPAGRLIIPGHNNDSYQWILQTQQMLALGEWRVRHVDYDNAPFGREVEETTPYRWWFGLVAWADHLISGRPILMAVEDASLWVDPILQGLFLVAGTIFVAWRFGRWSAAFFSLGMVTLFPFALGFIPGAPDYHGMAWLFALLSIAPLLAGVQPRLGRLQEGAVSDAARAHSTTRRWFFAAGILGGLALWVSVDIETSVLLGIALGAIIAGWVGRRGGVIKTPPLILPWLSWSVGGAVAVSFSYLAEFAPAHLLTWQLRAIHPLYGLAWLGSGFLISRVVDRWQSQKRVWTFREVFQSALAFACVAAFPLTAWKAKIPLFTALNLISSRLTKLYEDVSARNAWQWLLQNGITLRTVTVILPIGLVILALLVAWRRGADRSLKISTAIALGPVLVALGYACTELNWWNVFDAAVLLLGVAAAAALDEKVASPFALNRIKRWSGIGITIGILSLSVVQVVPPAMGAVEKAALDGSEVIGLIDRDLARWLAKQKGDGSGIVLAPPDQTIAFYYYGNLRGLGTLYWENVDGIGGAVRIVSASMAEEAQVLIERRGVSYIVIPSWDAYLDQYARIGSGQVEGAFIDNLHHWVLPNWLRPIAYTLPAIPGFENQTVVVLKTVEGQSGAAALAHSAEYFIDMGLPVRAAAVGQDLKKYPIDLGASIARAEIALAVNDEPSLEIALKTILPRLAAGGDRFLAFDRRVALATVLARTNQLAQARDQLQKAVQNVDEAKLRSLSIASLYRLQVLEKALDIKIADPHLYQLARDLLPTNLRSRL